MNQQPNTQPGRAPPAITGMAAGTIAMTVISILIGIMYSYGAAKLSYSKYGSVGWAILAFIFAPFYYPIYALFLHTPTAPTTILGGLRKMKW